LDLFLFVETAMRSKDLLSLKHQIIRNPLLEQVLNLQSCLVVIFEFKTAGFTRGYCAIRDFKDFPKD